MIVPSSDRAVISSADGSDSSATIREWYRVAVNGFGRPAKIPRPSWLIWLVLPCITTGA